MGTRGLYGFRKNGIDKTAYNHFDSYPDYLGRNIVRFCIENGEEEMDKMFNGIIMIDERSAPTPGQISFCRNHGLADLSVSSCSERDWYCLLRNAQGDLDIIKQLVDSTGMAYMIDNHTFILDSLFCEYAYIINLDTHVLEFYIGFQKQPQEDNRYGCLPDSDGYYPCRLVASIPLDEIKDEDDMVNKMNAIVEEFA